jgi:hypothetical protein
MGEDVGKFPLEVREGQALHDVVWEFGAKHQLSVATAQMLEQVPFAR